MLATLILSLLLVQYATTIGLKCDSYIELDAKGITFTIQQGTPPFVYTLTGLPSGIVMKGNTLTPVSLVPAGQYIVGIKVTDSQKQTDEKIIIVNVKQGLSAGLPLNKPTSGSASTSPSTPGNLNSNGATVNNAPFASGGTLPLNGGSSSIPSNAGSNKAFSSQPNPTSAQNNRLPSQSNPTFGPNGFTSQSNPTTGINYGSPSQTNGSPTQTNGFPSQTNGFPSQINGIPSQTNPNSGSGIPSQSKPSSGQSNGIPSQTNGIPSQTNPNLGSNNGIPGQSKPASQSNGIASQTNPSNVAPSQTNPSNAFPTQQNPSQSPNSINNLQNFFNQISFSQPTFTDSGLPSVDNSPQSNLNDILNQFSSGSPNISQTVKNSETLNPSDQTYTAKPLVNIPRQNTPQQQIPNDTETKSVFDRQKEAAAFVSGNFTIVQQITANKNYANALIDNITKQLNADQDIQKQLDNQVNQAASNKSSIDSAVNNVNSLLNTLSTQLTSTTTNLSQWSTQRNELQGQNRITQAKKADILKDIDNLNSQISQTNTGLSGKTKQCSDYSSLLTENTNNITTLNNQIAFVYSQIQQGQNDVNSKQATVEDLTRRLAEAQRDLGVSQENLQRLNNNQTSLQANLQDLQQNNGVLNENLYSCKQASSAIQNALQQLQQNTSQVLLNQLAQINSQNITESNSIQNLGKLISDGTAKQNSVTFQINTAKNTLTILQNALPKAQQTLSSLLSRRYQVQGDIQNDQDSLNAAIERFKDQTKNLQVATMNLQTARAEQKQADDAVNKLLASRANMLPYAVPVTNQDPLIGQTMVGKSINISNWFNFLSANFGTSVMQYFGDEGINCLYPMRGPALSANVGCPSDDSLSSFTGKVVGGTRNQVTISLDSQNGALFVLEMPQCVTLFSNNQNYSFKIGDSIIGKGLIVGNNRITVRTLICLGN